MTRKQQEFYRILVNQMVDFNEDFHKEFTIKRIEQIDDDKLKYLLEDINIDKDGIIKKKGYTTYAKFIYYADKMIEAKTQNQIEHKRSKVDKLYQKRETLLKSIENEAPNINARNQLIEDIKTKKRMFQGENGNFLDDVDYYIIEKFGFYNFFDSNRNYKIKENIEIYYKEYLTKTVLNSNLIELK
jgi:hypothetical protein